MLFERHNEVGTDIREVVFSCVMQYSLRSGGTVRSVRGEYFPPPAGRPIPCTEDNTPAASGSESLTPDTWRTEGKILALVRYHLFLSAPPSPSSLDTSQPLLYHPKHEQYIRFYNFVSCSCARQLCGVRLLLFS